MLRHARFSFIVLAACGGASSSDLFGTPPGADAGRDVAADVAVDVAVDATPPPPPPIVDASVPDVAPPPPPPVGAPIVCGKTLATASLKCDANQNEVCCRSGGGAQCTPDTQCVNDGDVPLGCSTTATCTALGLSGYVCCGNVDNSSKIDSSECLPANQCPNGNGTVRLCDKNGPNVCTSGTSCKTSSYSLPGYDLCLQ